MRSRLAIVALAAIAGASLIWGRGFVGLADGQTTKKELTTASIDRPAPAASQDSLELNEKQAGMVKVGAVGTREFAQLKTAVGTIDFNENMLVQVFSQYAGKIQKAFFNIGDDVKQGDVLFTIDSPDLLQAESTLLAAAGVLELQKRTLARATGLLKAGGSAQKDVDQATSDEQTAEGNFKAAKDSVRIFGKSDTEIDQILTNRKVDSTLVVPSPIAGRIVARNAAPGFLTQPGTAPAPFTMGDLSTMWMIANVIETDAPAYKLGQHVEAKVPAYPDTLFKGRVTALGSSIDPSSRRQLVRSEIDDPQHLLRSGMYASFVTYVADPIRSAAVQADGVVREGDGTMTVWVTSDNHHFKKRTVAIGLRQDGWVQILDGLSAGETVVTEGAVFLSNQLLLSDAG
ncbi:MAG TPA: efflux RND transporter periplasmic adaptor subunit [Bradyrhizobium sp.]|jgi:cobalt-zinc-cadmium efflux system membrane fusion protein|nr:efflux RND transporter periplasmic adaptor subunit [Bradyrhizobium sp.]